MHFAAGFELALYSLLHARLRHFVAFLATVLNDVLFSNVHDRKVWLDRCLQHALPACVTTWDMPVLPVCNLHVVYLSGILSNH